MLKARADTLRQRAASPASPTLDGMPRAPGFEGDRIGNTVGSIDLIERETEEKRREAAALYREIDESLHRLSGPHAAERRFVLQARYLDAMLWEDISYLLFQDREDFGDKEDSFRRRTFLIHKAALEDLAQILAL